MNTAQSIVAGAGRTIPLLEALTKDIPAERFARFTQNASGAVQANHPAFQIGHLAVYPPMIAGLFGVEDPALAVPESYPELFERGRTCHDDPGGTIYPAKDELVSSCLNGYRTVMEHLGGADPAKLEAENPLERMRGFAPTVGVAVTFMLVGHPMYHLGQLSTWRRVEGLGSVM